MPRDYLAPPEDRPITYDGNPAVAQLLDEAVADAQHNAARQERDKQDWCNLLFFRGGAANHFIRWDGHRWVPIPTDGEDGIPSWVVRCVTNVLKKKVLGVAALLDQSEPSQDFRPATDDDNDLATAQVAEDAVPVLREEIDYDTLKAQIHHHIALTDKVGLLLYYDSDEKYGTQPVQVLQCTDPACAQYVEPADAVMTDETDEAGMSGATCPHCGGELTDAVYPETHAQAGQPIGVDLPVGRICAEIIPAFELSLPSSATSADERKVPWILTHSLMPVERACALWPDHAEHIRGGRKQPASRGLTHQYADALRSLSAPNTMGTATSTDRGQQVLVYRLFHDPIIDKTATPPRHFPDGLFAVRIHDVVVEAGPLPIQDDAGQPLKSIIIRQYMPMPGSPFGDPVADTLVPVQVQRNMIETLILMILMHDAAPTTWVPAGVSLEDEPTGVPGAIHRYRGTPGERPQTERGVNPPEALYKSLELCDQKMDELSGLNAVLAGERPEGNPTLGEIQILRERGMGSFKTALDSLVRFETRLSQLLLYLARQSAWAPRFARIRGENGAWDVRQFTQADLRGHVDISCNPASAWPKSPLMTQLKIEKALELGVILPAQDPELQLKLLSELDLVELKPSLDKDRQQIMRKLDRWKQAQTPEEIGPPEPEVENLQMHQHFLRDWMKTEEAEIVRATKPMVYQAMRMHLAQIQMLLTPPAQVSHPPGQAEPADGSAVDAAMQAGVLRPATTPASPLEAAAGPGGLLRPAGTGEAAGKAGAMNVDAALGSGLIRPAPPRPQ